MQEKVSKYINKKLNFMGLIFLGSFLFLTQPSFAIGPNLMDGDIPIKINANDMEYDMDDNTVTFAGNVVVTRGEFIMRSAKMTIFMYKNNAQKPKVAAPPKDVPLTGIVPQIKSQDGTTESNNIERIEAYSGVTFDYGTQKGTSESAIYNAQKGLLTMNGNPVVREGENVIRGNTIRYYMNERRSEVVGSKKKRVEAIFSNKN